MSKALTITDTDYLKWVKQLGRRHRASRTKAAVHVKRRVDEVSLEPRQGHRGNAGRKQTRRTLSRHAEQRLAQGEARIGRIFRDQHPPCKRFHYLYAIPPQVVEESNTGECRGTLPEDCRQQEGIFPQVVEELAKVPWGHHRYIIDRYSEKPGTALFYVRKTMENGWSRSMLLNFLDTDLHKREGKAVTNFGLTLPKATGDLAQELTRDPYCFAFTGLRERYNERQLKDALIANIQAMLLELGTGFAYMGREYRLQIGETEQFLDMLFYNVRLRCYVVVEVKTEPFAPAHVGQLSTYVVAVDHILRKKTDNKTLGLLICKTKDNVFAQYALEGSNQPLGISEYELSKLYPEKVEGTIPTIEEIEARLGQMTEEQP